MAEALLEQALLDGGNSYSHFFNGRLLTAEALSTDQQAHGRRDAWLGRALGQGVAWGLEVSLEDGEPAAGVPGGSKLSIEAGLAIDVNGRPLYLDRKTTLNLEEPGAATREPGTFSAGCVTGEGEDTYSGEGLYALVIGEAEGFEGDAATTGTTGSGSGCGRAHRVEGVQFLVIPLSEHMDGLAPPEEEQGLEWWRFRAEAASHCFGDLPADGDADSKNGMLLDGIPGLAAGGTYGLVDHLIDKDRLDWVEVVGRRYPAQVPLALLFWTDQGVRFVDNWALRRSLLAPDALGNGLFRPRGRRHLEGQARFMQFQDQLDRMNRSADDTAGMVKNKCFRFLPAAGYVHSGNAEDDLLAPATWFDDRHWPCSHPLSSVLGTTLEKSWLMEPIDLENQERYVAIVSGSDGFLFARPGGCQSIDG